MDQLSLFGEAGQSIDLPSGLVEYIPGVFSTLESNYLLDQFINHVPWEQKMVKMYNKEMATPRLTAWYGDPGTNYSFTGITLDPMPWTPELLMMKERVEALAGVRFNSVLLNYYRNGNDSVAWHRDNERILGTKPVIASVSLGQVRNFDIRLQSDHSRKYTIRLENGSYLLMKGDLQEHWEHQIAKSTKPMKPRINLTFRRILTR